LATKISAVAVEEFGQGEGDIVSWSDVVCNQRGESDFRFIGEQALRRVREAVDMRDTLTTNRDGRGTYLQTQMAHR
jgi:hypothetical protein